MTHEPDAPELTPDAERQATFDGGHAVGALARSYVPGGVLIDPPRWQIEERVAATREALRNGARVVYEASFARERMRLDVCGSGLSLLPDLDVLGFRFGIRYAMRGVIAEPHTHSRSHLDLRSGSACSLPSCAATSYGPRGSRPPSSVATPRSTCSPMAVSAAHS